MQSGATIRDERLLPKPPVKILTDPPQGIGDKDNFMPTRRQDDTEMDRLEAAVTAMAQAITAQATARRPSVAAWVAAGVAALALLISVSDTRWTSAGESDLKRDIAVLAEKINQADERQKERERVADRERALLEERYRQVSIALETKGIKLPKQ